MNNDVKHYLDAVPESRKDRILSLHRLIMDLYPQASVDMSYKMPTYRFSEGWVAIANQKNYVSLYTCGPHHIAAFKLNHPGIKTGKGCINLREQDNFPADDLKNVIRHAIESPK